jgi:hypothetical protein
MVCSKNAKSVSHFLAKNYIQTLVPITRDAKWDIKAYSFGVEHELVDDGLLQAINLLMEATLSL